MQSSPIFYSSFLDLFLDMSFVTMYFLSYKGRWIW